MATLPANPASSSWLLIPPNASTADLRLFCFPYAGGGTWIFREWLKEMGDEIAVHPVKLPGRADRMGETAATDLHKLADTLAQQIQSVLRPPYALFGCSMGAFLAYECAHRLIRNGAPPPQRLIVAAAPAPSKLKIEEPLHRLPDARFLAALQAKYNNPMMALLNDEILPLVLPALRADMTMYETYQPRPDTPPLPCPITAIGGIQDSIPEANIRAWQQHAAGPCTTKMLPGGHFLIHEQEAAIIELVRTGLAQDAPTGMPVEKGTFS